MPRVVCEAILARLARIQLIAPALRLLCAANTKAPSDDPVRRGLFGLSCLIKIIPISPIQVKPKSSPIPGTSQNGETPCGAGRSLLNGAFIYPVDDLLSH